MNDTDTRLSNTKNPNQGSFKKVLCLCSAGLLRSPTTALVLSQEPFNYNTRSAGMNPHYALILVDKILVTWADEIVCMEQEQARALRKEITDKPIICLDLPDDFGYRDPELMSLIKKSYLEKTNDQKT